MISSLCSFIICWNLFINSVISISTCVKLFTMVLYWLKPLGITHYLAYVYYHHWLCWYFPFLTYIKMHIFNLSSLFMKFFHMFILPDVLSASIVCVAFMEVALYFTLVTTELSEILNMILSYKSCLAFVMTSHIYWMY